MDGYTPTVDSSFTGMTQAQLTSDKAIIVGDPSSGGSVDRRERGFHPVEHGCADPDVRTVAGFHPHL